MQRKLLVVILRIAVAEEEGSRDQFNVCNILRDIGWKSLPLLSKPITPAGGASLTTYRALDILR
jgi:hypothetical protein